MSSRRTELFYTVAAVSTTSLLLVSCTLAYALAGHSQPDPDVSDFQPPKAEVVVGKAIKWRTLDSRPRANKSSAGMIGSLLPGSFSGPKRAELLLVPSDGTDSIIYNASGLKQRTSLALKDTKAFAWDANGDGMSEVLIQPESYHEIGTQNVPEQKTRVYKVNGSQMTTLDGIAAFANRSAPRDYNGDGKPDLALHPNGPSGDVSVWGKGPSLIARIASIPGFLGGYTLGDTDGDGKAEVIEVGSGKSGMLDYYSCRDSRPARFLVTLPRDWQRGLIACMDVDGDGVDDLILNTGVYNLRTKKLVSFQFPAKTKPENMLGIRPVACGAFLPGKGRLLAMPVSPKRFGRTGLALFRPDGSCAYYEEFGEDVYGMVKLHDANGDHLVVQFWNHISIYP